MGRRSKEERDAIMNEIHAAIVAGETRTAACERFKITPSNYYAWSKKQKEPKSSSMLTIPIPDHGENIIVMIGNPRDINAALEKASRIGR